jgi:hypothetical protein
VDSVSLKKREKRGMKQNEGDKRKKENEIRKMKKKKKEDNCN